MNPAALPPIRIRGARMHNLQGISVDIPRNQLTVITGPSGSGKSSLAFDTLFAEGQRRYMQSLSAYVRQFLDQMERPHVDSIDGLSPAIAIEQRTAAGNPRSTIATITEIFDHLRVLFAHAGIPHHPQTGKPLQRMTVEDMVTRILERPEGQRFIVLAPISQEAAEDIRTDIERLKRQGFTRIRLDGEIYSLEDPITPASGAPHALEVVVDRLKVEPTSRSRLADSLEQALRLGDGVVLILWPGEAETRETLWKWSNRNFDPETGFRFPDLTPSHFSFNSPLGACPVCQGLGTEMLPDPALLIPDGSKTLAEGAIVPWHRAPKAMQGHYKSLLRDLVRHAGVPFDQPWDTLPPSFHQLILEGSSGVSLAMTTLKQGRVQTEQRPFRGLIALIQEMHDHAQSPLARQRARRYMTRQVCRSCRGQRLRPELLAVRLPAPPGQTGHNIHEFCDLNAATALGVLRAPLWSAPERSAFSELRHEIESRLDFLCRVGLPYLTLNREAGTLSGGEMQRIRLASQIGSGLTGVLYVLDEPSIGLHPRDQARLLETLDSLRDRGNTVVVVEHDEDTIRHADHVIELGESAGRQGGRLIAESSPSALEENPRSLTGRYLSGALKLTVNSGRTSATRGWVDLIGASEHNLKDVDFRVPIGCFTCVTGVSGSGKSTLVHDVFARAVFRHFGIGKEPPGAHRAIHGLDAFDKCIVIDQSPIGRSPRSNPATYLGAFDGIRTLFAQLPLARVRGYSKSRFSFNMRGGRCERCEGDGVVKMEMQLLPDVYILCEACGGKRFNRETLEVTYKGHTIADILNLTVEEALTLFRAIPDIADRLEALVRVGLGYLTLGQGGTSLSGGEAQRIKLAAELARKSTGKTLYILDEPTTGLHFADVEILLSVLFNLRNAGNTILVIEHHLDVIKNADHIIDLGPEGGDQGGLIVATGTPEAVAACPESHTGRHLAAKLQRHAYAIATPHEATLL
jgi:excinuclease ABC subunit A